MPAGRRGGVILVNPGISGVFLKTGPGTPLGVASLNLNLNLLTGGTTHVGTLQSARRAAGVCVVIY